MPSLPRPKERQHQRVACEKSDKRHLHGEENEYLADIAHRRPERADYSDETLLSSMIISIPEIRVAMATTVISRRMTITFVSSSESHWKYPAPWVRGVLHFVVPVKMSPSASAFIQGGADLVGIFAYTVEVIGMYHQTRSLLSPDASELLYERQGAVDIDAVVGVEMGVEDSCYFKASYPYIVGNEVSVDSVSRLQS